MNEGIFEIGMVALATSAISLTVSKSALFEGFRGWLGKTSILGKLFHCHYCLSHWVAGALVAMIQPEAGRLFRWPTLWLVDWFVLSMAVVALAAMVSNAIISGMRNNGQ